MPINLPDRKNGPRSSKSSRPGLVPDILDGLAVAFCILMIAWAAQHVVFDYLANPNRSAIFSSTNTSGQISINTVPSPERM
jgi:hypothetical protein